MDSIDNFKNEVLNKLQMEMKKEGIEAEFSHGGPELPIPILNFFLEVDENPINNILMELSFIPMDKNAEEESKVSLFQIFGNITKNILPGRFEELRKAFSNLNFYLPIGAFGLDESSGTLFLKYNLVVLRELGEEKALKSIDVPLGMLISFADRYLEVLTAIARGEMSTESAMRDGLIPR